MIVNFIKQHESAQLPTYATTEAAGADIYSVENCVIPAGTHKLVSTGLGCNIPKGWELQVRPRSGLALKKKVTVLNSPGTIDSDYPGLLGVVIINHGNEDFSIGVGDRIAQIVVAPVYQATFAWTDSVKQTDRTGGFGSTGV